MKIMTLVGTRPEVIRLSAVIKRLDETKTIDHVLVHTGQNWDHSLNGVFFEELAIRPPDHSLGIDGSSLGSALGDILRMTEVVLKKERPDAFLVLGDTNSALGAIIAKRMQIPVYHMEAGNRCFDENVPEETNRRIVDHTADFNLVYTSHARRNLLREGIEPRRIFLTGSPMAEVLGRYRPGIEDSPVLDELELEPRSYYLVSAHRQETVDSPARLAELVNSLNLLADDSGLRVIVSTHPRTRQRLVGNHHLQAAHPSVSFVEPFGFFAYNRLQMAAKCVLSDSGTISEESAILGFPAVTLRSSIERPEALDAGGITMVDLDSETILRGIDFAVSRGEPVVPQDYAVTNTSERVLNVILSTVHSHRRWSGLLDPLP